MAHVLIEYDASNSSAKKIMDFLLSFEYFKSKEMEDECPYNEEFIKKIEASRKSKGIKIKLEDLWK